MANQILPPRHQPARRPSQFLFCASGRRQALRNLRYMRPSHPRSASCLGQPWLHREFAASRSRPSISRRGPCRLGLFCKEQSELVKMDAGHECKISPKLIPGFSSRTFSRCSLAKNIYADRPRLGAFGSVEKISFQTH